MDKKIDVEKLFVGNVKYCMDRRDAYPGEKTGVYVGDIFAHGVLLMQFEDVYVPFYMVKDKDDFNKLVSDFENQDFEKQRSRIFSRVPLEAGDEYVSDLVPFKVSNSKQILNFKEIKKVNDEWELEMGNEEYSYDLLDLEI